jgi:diguanylate cyclase (GGDEF)-like protein
MPSKHLHAPRVLLRHPWMAGILAGLFALLLQESFISVEQDRRHQAEMAALQARTATVRARLESELNSTLSVSLGLSSLVLSNPDFTRAQFEQVAASLVRMRPSIRSVAIAPDNVIRYIYPLKDNFRALGLRYLDNAEQRDAVLRLMHDKQPVIAGPIQLVQGGLGIINRIPILFTRGDGQTRYWGVASVAIDPLPIFRQAGVNADNGEGMEYALRGKDGLGAAGELFLGDGALFTAPDAVLMDVVIPGGKWQLAAQPAASADRDGAWRYLVQVLALLIATLTGAMLGAYLQAHGRIRAMALEDSLTGLANRHQFLMRGRDLFALAKRSGRHLTLLNMDLNGFKAINDRHGHEVGDRVLVHVARQLRDCLRESDLLARLGGDEFLALFPDTAAGPMLDALLERLRLAVTGPVPDLKEQVSIGISIGTATCSDSTATLEDLMRQADAAMYRSKVAARRDDRRQQPT